MKKAVLTLVLLTVFLVTLMFVRNVSALPTGATLSEGESERLPTVNPDSDGAFAGNITRADFVAISITHSWQGYFGNVTGTLTLSDANNYTLYNWSLANPEGEVYAANDTITWTNIQCFNFTATGTYADDTAQRGTTSLYGMNLSILESLFGIKWDDEDGVNETFSDSTNHDLFYTNSLEFSAGECVAVNLFNASGTTNSEQFQEVLLYDPDDQLPVFASILEETSVLGFNQEDNDFEMIVLENGHGTDLAVTTYYFYLELGAN